LGVDQTFSTLFIEAMNPIAQRLAVHATDARRLRAAHSVVNRSQGQEAPRLVGVLRRSGQTAQLIRLKISPKTNCSAHSHPPNQNARVEMNHTAQPANKSHIYRRLVLVLTPNFFSNDGWSKREYDSIFTREIVEKQKVILPIWHQISVDVYHFSPILADRVAVQWSLGVDEVARKLLQAIE
jgi:hypothetical protein